MHIADGYLSPVTVAVSYAVAVPLWVYGFKKLKEKLNEETLPVIGALAALSFVIMMFNVPVPGGTSGHAVGAALISILFGPWVGFVSVSLVLLIQSIVFGDGGISAWAVNSFAMGFVGSFVGYLMGLSHLTTLIVVLFSTLIAIILWTYFIKNFEATLIIYSDTLITALSAAAIVLLLWYVIKRRFM